MPAAISMVESAVAVEKAEEAGSGGGGAAQSPSSTPAGDWTEATTSGRCVATSPVGGALTSPAKS